MINVLPPEEMRQLVASRSNSLLLRYTILLGVFVIIIAAEITGVFFILQNSKQAYTDTIATNDRDAASLKTIEQESSEFTKNLSTAKTIMDKQVSYTGIIKTISDLIPSGVIMNSLDIDPKTFGTATTLDVQAKTYNDAIEFRNKLNESGKFTNVNFKAITYKPDEQSSYKYAISYNITYSKELLVK